MVDKSRIKYINSLGDKKFRDADRVFVAEGPKIINELLDEPAIDVQEIFAVEDWIADHPEAGATGVDEKMLARLSFLTTPNKVIGLFSMPHLPSLQLKNKVSVLVDTIQDPGNLGTIIRCADWFGVEQVICSKTSADVFNPKTVQASMGSVGRVKVYYENLADVLGGVRVYAATLDGSDIRNVDPITEGAIIIGNESKGINDELLKLSHQKITIFRKGKAESLNAGVATGIILSYLVR